MISPEVVFRTEYCTLTQSDRTGVETFASFSDRLFQTTISLKNKITPELDVEGYLIIGATVAYG